MHSWMAAWSWYQLAGHVLHWLLPVACWNHPPGHCLHAVLVSVFWYHPVGQFSHTLAGSPSWSNSPFAQLKHCEAPFVTRVPAAWCVV